MNILETAAHTNSGFFHPGGRATTDALIAWLDLQPSERVLEIGCGAGATAQLVSERTQAQVVTFDILPAMLKTAQIRFQSHQTLPVQLLTANVNEPLPFADATFDAVYAESVIALNDLPHILHEVARVLKVGGKVVLNERIWRHGVSETDAAYINACSQRWFGIPAATAQAWHKDDWLKLLAEVGFPNATATLVDDLIMPTDYRQETRQQRLIHIRHHLAHPMTYLHNLRFRWLGRRYEHLWGRLVSYLFLGVREV